MTKQSCQRDYRIQRRRVKLSDIIRGGAQPRKTTGPRATLAGLLCPMVLFLAIVVLLPPVTPSRRRGYSAAPPRCLVRTEVLGGQFLERPPRRLNDGDFGIIQQLQQIRDMLGRFFVSASRCRGASHLDAVILHLITQRR